MTEHEQNQICPEDVIKVLLPAKQIPHGSKVSKRTGQCTLILNHRVRLFVPKQTEFLPQEIVGFFLQGSPQADLNQISGDTELHWHVTADDFKDYLERIWEPIQQ